MATSRRTRWWDQARNTLKRYPDGLELPCPSNIVEWTDDMKRWPPVCYKDIFNYLVLCEGVDGDTMDNYKSMASYNYFHSSKVGAVFINEPAKGFVFLKAEVAPSLSVNSTKHQAWVLVTTSGTVETAGCSCIAGKGKSCSHAGAILWKLEYATSTSRSGIACTDEQQQWNQGTSKNIAPRRIADINFTKYRTDSKYDDGEVKQRSASLPKRRHYLTRDQFVAAVQSSALKELYLIPNTLINKCLTASPLPKPTVAVNQHESHTCENSCQKCSNFYKKYVSANELQRSNLETATRMQHLSELWHDSRKLRITASSAKAVPVRESTNPDSFLRRHLYPMFKGNFATRHGQSCEPLAIAELANAGFPVTVCGTVISSDEPWLSASPDGACGDVLIEVKCPLLSPKDKLLDIMAVRYCCDSRLVAGKPVLDMKGSRGYYLQVQLAMHCTKLNLCKFCIWTKEQYVIIDVPFDKHFVDASLLRLKTFYFKHMLPRIVDDIEADRLKLSREYKNIFSE